MRDGRVMQGWTIMMMLLRKSPSLAEEGRWESVQDLALLAAPWRGLWKKDLQLCNG